MQPSSEQLERIQTAVAKAFNPDELRDMLRYRLDTNITHIVSDKANLTVQTRDVVFHFAYQKGGLHKLLEAASGFKPDAPAIKAVYAELGGIEFDPLPRPIPGPNVALIVAGIVAAIAFMVVVIIALRNLSHAPREMTGDLNIAVAQFGVLRNDTVGDAPEPNGLADALSNVLQVEVSQLISGTGFEVQWLRPEEVGVIVGDSATARKENAEQVARSHRADLLIYGYVNSDDLETIAEPLLYVASTRLVNAEEMAGTYPMGGKLQMQGDIEHNSVVSKEVSDQLTLRTGALARFALGLGYFALGRYNEAAPHFAEANRQAVTTDQRGREAILLFLGNTAGKLGDLSLAGHYYKEALAEDEGYVRAQLGDAQIEFLLGKDNCKPGKIDVVRIENAMDGYRAARDALNQPELAEIPTKATFYMGQANACLAEAGDNDRYAAAKTQLTQVTDYYSTTQKLSVRYLAAEAHGLLGKIAVTRAVSATNDADRLALWREAEGNYRKAIELSQQRDRKATYSLWLTQLAIWQGMAYCPDARARFAEAQQFAAEFLQENPSATMGEYDALRDEMAQRLSLACPPTPVSATP